MAHSLLIGLAAAAVHLVGAAAQEPQASGSGTVVEPSETAAAAAALAAHCDRLLARIEELVADRRALAEIAAFAGAWNDLGCASYAAGPDRR